MIFAASHRPDLRVSQDDALDFVLRKLAHLAVFGILAILIARAIQPGAPWTYPVLALAWSGTLAWAVSDEWHQTFVAGRVGHPSDVAIDMTGATIALVGWRLLHRRRGRPDGDPA